MEEKSKYISPGDSLIIETRQNDNGEYKIVNPQFEFGGVISETAFISIYLRTVSNGTIYSDWQLIGRQRVAVKKHLIEYVIKKGQVLQIKFVRSKDEVAGLIEFVKFYTYEGTYTLVGRETPTLDASMFSAVNSDHSIVNLENNIFKKLYYRGIIPNYIKRSDNRSLSEDGDYIALFSAISRFFALIIKFFKRWEKLVDDEEMLKEILRNHGIQFDESRITMFELKHITQNIYNEFSKRGTKEMFLFAGDTRSDGTIVDIDGEFMRMIRAKRYTELLVENIPKTEMGWCLGKSSPMYRGLSNNCYDLNKFGANKMLYSNLDEYKSKFLWFGGISIGTTRNGYEGKTVRWMNNNVGVGIGRIDASVVADDYMIPVDACMDYEITIALTPKTLNNGAFLMAYVEGFNENKIKLPDSFITPDKSTVVMTVHPDSDDIICGNFFDSEQNGVLSLDKLLTDKDYYIRFIIKAYSSEPQSDCKLNIGFGNELHFNNSFVRYILPTIMVANASVEVFNIHMRPLVRGTNINRIIGEDAENCFSLGFLQTSKFVHMYLRNRNTSMSEQDAEDFINRYMMPYSGTNLITFIK